MYRLKSGCLAFAVLFACVSTFTKALSEIEVLSSKPTRCTYEHAFDMYGAHCAGLGLTEIPKLRGGIEILDFSDNKLREIHSNTLSSYTSVKYLYLTENQIYNLEENALSALTVLQSLDLSKNVLLELPNSLFQLPSLRKLYLSGNPLMYLTSDLPISKPIKAPLELLDLSDCKIRELPNWGHLPQLLFYNISHNPLLSLPANHFSVMCNLGKVDLTESINKIKLCDIKPTIMFLQEKVMYFQLGDYTKLNSREFENCPSTIPESASLNATYHTCRTLYTEVQSIKTSRRTWLTIGGGLLGFLVGFMLLLYVMHRRNVAQTKTTAEKIKKVTPIHDGDRKASAVLLNGVS